jgi:hypothetical protein
MRNAATAHHWWRLAAINGHERAAADLEAQMMGKPPHRVVASNLRKFEKWLQRLRGFTKAAIVSLVAQSDVLTEDTVSSLTHARTAERLVELLCHLCTEEQMEEIFVQEVRRRYHSDGVRRASVVADDTRGKLRRAGRCSSLPNFGPSDASGLSAFAAGASPAARRGRTGSVVLSPGGVRLGDVFLKHLTPLEKQMWREAEHAELLCTLRHVGSSESG